MKKKKNYTPEQQVKRGKIALLVIGAMLLIIFIGNLSNRNNKKQENNGLSYNDSLTVVMDTKIDSLLKDFTKGKYELIHKGEIQQVKQHLSFPYESELQALELKLNVLVSYDKKTKEITEEEYIETLDKYTRLQLEKNKFIMMESTSFVVDSRRLRFLDSLNNEYVCSQQHFRGFHRLNFIAKRDTVNIDTKTIKKIIENENSNIL